MIATCAARKSLSPKVISSVAVVSFSFTTGTTRQASRRRERLTGVQIVGAQLEVRGGEQDLGGPHVAFRQPLLVGPEEAPLADRRGRLQLVDRGGPGRQLQHPHAAGDRARGDHDDVLAADVQLGDLRADAVEHVAAESSPLSGDDRGAEFRDHGHGAAILGRVQLELEVADDHLVAGLEAGALEGRDHADLAQPSSRGSRAPPGSRGRGARSAARSRGPLTRKRPSPSGTTSKPSSSPGR